MILEATAVLVALFLTRVWLRKQSNAPKASHSLPLIGHVLVLRREYAKFNDWLYLTSRDFGFKPWSFSLLSNTFVVISSPNELEHVLKSNFEGYAKGKVIDDRMRDLFGEGIFNADGEKWKIQRKTAAKIFCTKTFKYFVGSVLPNEMHRLLGYIGEKETETVVDLKFLLFRFTLGSFMRLGFGVDFYSDFGSGQVPFEEAFDRAQKVVDYRFISPFWRLEELLGQTGRQMKKDIDCIYSFCNEIIRTSRSITGPYQENTLMALFSGLRDASGARVYSDEKLAGIILNFIIAGRDTTAQALSWTLYLLDLEAEMKEKVMREIDAVLGDTPFPSFEALDRLEYTKACFFESLRLYPSVPKDFKVAVRDDTLPDGTFIPKGTRVMWSAYAMGRMESTWGKDSESFRPERWLDTSEKPSQFEFPVFNAGPRACLGKKLAEIEGIFFLASFLKHLDYKILNRASVRYANSITMPMEDELLVNVKRRRTNS